VSLAQLIRTVHNICKVWSSNPEHHKKKDFLLRKIDEVKSISRIFDPLPLLAIKRLIFCL